MVSADFSIYRNTEPNSRPPPVRAFSFGQSLLNLHNKHFSALHRDVDMLCCLILFTMPHIQFLSVSTDFCSLASFSLNLAVNDLATC